MRVLLIQQDGSDRCYECDRHPDWFAACEWTDVTEEELEAIRLALQGDYALRDLVLLVESECFSTPEPDPVSISSLIERGKRMKEKQAKSEARKVEADRLRRERRAERERIKKQKLLEQLKQELEQAK